MFTYHLQQTTAVVLRICQSVTSNSKHKSNTQPQTYYNIHILMYVTLQFVSIIINRIVVTKHVNPDLEKNAVHSYEYSNISAKNGQPSSVIKPRLC